MRAPTSLQPRFAADPAAGRPVPDWANGHCTAALVGAPGDPEAIAEGSIEVVGGAGRNEDSPRDRQLLRFREQASRAARETDYYRRLFAGGADPETLSWEEIARLPLTGKESLRQRPSLFVRRGSNPVLRPTMAGTTGRSIQIAFSAAEVRAMIRLAADGDLLGVRLEPDDVVVLATDTGAIVGNMGIAGACSEIGALLLPMGQVAIDQALSLLTQTLEVPGKRTKPSFLWTTPSYLGAIVEQASSRGLGHRDFGFRRIVLSGDVVTAGLRARAGRLFGDAAISVYYGVTETLPFGGVECEQGHLHFAPDRGLLEVVDPTTGAAVPPGAVGNLVVTPLPPYRETTILLRYDTEDFARRLAAPPSCRRRNEPGVGELLGARPYAVRHDRGWTYPREVLEALEANPAVPLPARCSLRAVPTGVALEVVARTDDPAVRQAIARGLDAAGVPVRELRVVTTAEALPRPSGLRADLSATAADGIIASHANH
jgi:phenylacetate-coenzyme A ligase PaaK-like adenylate-forming protein